MRKSIYIALLASIFTLDSNASNSARPNGKKSVRASSNARRFVGLRAAAVSADTVASTTKTETKTEEAEVKKEKTQKECEELFYACMDGKTNETVMSNEFIYSDYSDMLSDIYAGVTAPVFKCIYSDDVKSLYSKYNFGRDIFGPSNGRIDKIEKNSINYYAYLKDNATKVANKKIPITEVNRDVLKMVGIETMPIGLKLSVELPDVSYNVTTINGSSAYKLNSEYCLDPTKNTELEGCKKIKQDWANNYRRLPPTSSKSCEDYEVFLSEKLTDAKKSATDYIFGLKKKIETIIDEYNLKKEAEEELKNLNEEPEKDINYMTAGSSGGMNDKTDTSKKGVAASVVAGSVARKVVLPLLGLPPI